jgi:hypothetical protein
LVPCWAASSYEPEQATRYFFTGQRVAVDWAEPAGAGSSWFPFDPHHVLDCLSDGMEAPDDRHQLVPACLALHDGKGNRRVLTSREPNPSSGKSAPSRPLERLCSSASASAREARKVSPPDSVLGPRAALLRRLTDLEVRGESELAARRVGVPLGGGAATRRLPRERG